MSKFPKVSKAFHLVKSEELTGTTFKALAGALAAGGLALSAIVAEAHIPTSGSPDAVVKADMASNPAGQVMLLAPSLADDTMKSAAHESHYSHSSHASHASHYSHYSSR